MRKTYFFPVFLFLIAVWLVSDRVWPKQLSLAWISDRLFLADTYSVLPENAGLQEDERHVYLLNFPLSKVAPGNMGIYLPEYKPVSVETARYYGGIFNIGEDERETDEYYAYENDEGNICIDKNLGRLRYAAKDFQGFTEDGTDDAVISPEEAMEKAVAFIEGNLLFLSYEESRVRYDGTFYEVVFVNLLANVQNYAHPTKVILDRQGRVVTMDYYFLTYKRISSCRIKTMRDAFWELPDDFPEDVKIPLTQCRLVYFYEDSIVQPAYLFEGTYPGGKSFSSFVKASVYE